MTDETRPDGEEPGATAIVTEEIPEPESAAAEVDGEVKKLHQTVEMKDIGPCKKHIKVTIERVDIDRLLDKKFSELVVDANVSGFRPGKAPRKIIEKRFRKEVTEQLRGEILMQSLEQVAEEQDVAPLTPPELDPKAIVVPDKGDMVYEFDVEVRPQFDLPNYKGLKLRKPVRAFTDADVEMEEHRILAPYGSLIPKPEGNAQVGDYLVTDLTTTFGDRTLSSHKEISIRIDPRLALKDGVADKFASQVQGANGGETRMVDIKLSDGVSDAALQGQMVQAKFDIKEIKSVRLPELTRDFLREFGVHSPEQLRERVRVLLERRLEYQQRQSAREQVLQLIAAAATWDLPRDLLLRQAKRAFNRRIMEMQSAGMGEQEIRGRMRMLEHDVVQSTALALKEHFVLQKIAEVEKLEIDEVDIDDEIDRMAAQSDESPRRVRAKLEKEDMMEALATEIIERKSLDLILDSAEYTEFPMEQEQNAVSTVEEQAVPGEMRDPTAVPEPEEKKEESPAPNQS